jgi:hypothetical protein
MTEAQNAANRRAYHRQKGSSFERDTADYFALELQDDRIDRRPKRGVKDRGDVGGVRVHGQRLVIECKHTKQMKLSEWVKEAEAERGNDDALAGLVVHKRTGKGRLSMADQYVTLTLGDLIALITGNRDHLIGTIAQDGQDHD